MNIKYFVIYREKWNVALKTTLTALHLQNIDIFVSHSILILLSVNSDLNFNCVSCLLPDTELEFKRYSLNSEWCAHSYLQCADLLCEGWGLILTLCLVSDFCQLSLVLLHFLFLPSDGLHMETQVQQRSKSQTSSKMNTQ